MRCQHCHQNEATIRLNMQINSVHKHMVLCETCYNELTRKPSMSMGPQSFGFPFEHAFQPKEHSAAKQSEKKGLLDELAQNITNGAKAGLIDPVIGRDEEVARVIEILNRRNKNNPVLIGEPGVGKTAIAEGLALKIAEGDVPNKLKNKELYLLDVASLVANTGIRGQFEERMKQLITELKERKNVILFIDEIHLLVGAGSAEGSMDAGNILKPALARGELQVIGATTLKEYRQIEKDAALERRFQPVMVQEPSIEQAILILQGIKDKYEAYHGVTFSDEAIKACVTLSSRYIQDRHLPDKAIDLLDEAGSKANLLIDELNDEDAAERLTAIEAEKTKALEEENYELAAKLRDEEIALDKKLNSSSAHSDVTVEAEHIQDIIEQKTGIPVGKLQADEQTKMKELEAKLRERVIGQEVAVQKVAKAVRRSRAGLKSKNRPVGSFLFVGPTGVGKTELSKTLADELFGTKDAIIRLDMSEYMEKHAVSKIIGSPPGYVGHEEAGQLTEKVRRNPYSIVLLDEIEKAHPDVQHMFLQIMEDGRLTDSQGRTVSFKDTVIIMTSNAGAGEKQTKVGFQSDDSVIEEQTLIDSLSMFFKPEFLNRFDSIIEFRSLEKEHLVKIVSLLLGELEETLSERGISLSVTDEAKEILAELGYHPSFGARPLRRTIQEWIEDKMTDLLLDNSEITSFHVTAEDHTIKVQAK
ncbi:ATP-dependent protease ATP-binding subunit ClpE [Bacillus spizizenii ATCC 6633 = JCM 2499]|uniref:ATP-dependent Clp protease (Class III stress protein) n=1 Tax=Bacillus spizizenii (strain ATCC 23059 / NRRL B-14472 / W23) TaxID=655816 RepID=E0U366_BACSH|nr:ATP-dependent protease ATP-binding subunit ClpE [Bacillus spizizenii]QCJ16684.1 AAA family ATPase [Bacillus subtilis]ADM37456.1 ATP-dependent Clp protease (class III stress protein) [Bacillus spizizenii str. W23]AJW86825.1 Clp protease ClpX [Bacillus spizizenii]EFG94058.1 ATP-dependent Clp protease (class III stress gene) [Bacillus spizizenii ATCC 6633 = JCM 2499]KFK80637.1 ATP-dependent Clp protease ATP-binding subunit ClpE [Bacillus spizizenii]